MKQHLLVATFFSLMPGAFAASSDKSLDQLSQGLQNLVDSSNRLVVANEALLKQTNAIKQKVGFLVNKDSGLDKSIEQLQDELRMLEGKTKNRAGIIEQYQLEVDKNKSRLLKLGQDLEMRKIMLSQRQKQQEYVFKILNIINNGGTVEENIQMVKMTQEQLADQLEKGRLRVQDLEDRWREVSFWYGDASLSTPQLLVSRDQLMEKLASLKDSGVSENWSNLKARIHQVNRDIKELSKNHSSYLKTLEVIESRYTGRDAAVKTRNDEKKLQQALGRIKKDNKVLQRQVADLRFEMVDLDKKKTFLEASLAQNK